MTDWRSVEQAIINLRKAAGMDAQPESGNTWLKIEPAPKSVWPPGCHICISVRVDRPGTVPTYVALDRQGNAMKYAIGDKAA